MKAYKETMNIGRAKYVISFDGGIKKYQDGSNFEDIHIFSNKKDKNKFIKQLEHRGYTHSL